MAYYHRNRNYKNKNTNIPPKRKLQMICSKHGELFGTTQDTKIVIYESLNNDQKTVELKCYKCLEEYISIKQNEISLMAIEKFGALASLNLSSRANNYERAAILTFCIALFGSGLILLTYNIELTILSAVLFGIVSLVLWSRCKYLEKKSYEILGFKHKHSVGDVSSIVREEEYSVSKWRLEQANLKIERMNYSYEEIDKMTGIEFESFVKNLLQKLGYQNVQTTKASGDEGVDIIAYSNRKKIAIQCKRYNNKVTNSAIQEVFSGKHFYNCQEAYVITNWYFTQNAINLAKKLKVKLIDRKSLFDLVEQSKGNSLQEHKEYQQSKGNSHKEHKEYQIEFIFD